MEPDGHALSTVAGLIDAGEVTVEVEETFPLDEVREAHVRGETGRTRGKLVLTVAGDASVRVPALTAAANSA